MNADNIPGGLKVQKPNTALPNKNLIPTVKLLCCLGNSGLYQLILQEKIRVSVCELKLSRRLVMWQDNDPKYKSIYQRKVQVLADIVFCNA